MKELIIKSELLRRLCENCGYCDRQEFHVDRCNVYILISEQKPVVYVSDDFPTYKERCERND